VPERTIADVYLKLREQALGFGSEEIRSPPPVPGGRVLGVVMDLGYDTAVASVVSLADGTTSMYVSSGAVVLGAGESEQAAAATRQFVEAAEATLSAKAASGLATGPADGLPAEGRVRFNVLTTEAPLSVEAAEDELRSGALPLTPLYLAGQNVIGEIRRVDEARQET
jgi:hypothetical protein